MSSQVYIYALAHPTTAEIRYVGKTRDLAQRTRFHRGENGRAGRTARACWLRHLEAEGLSPEVLVLDLCDQAVWPEYERAWIAHYNSDRLLNHLPGGEGGPGWPLGRPMPEATKRKLSELARNREVNPVCLEALRRGREGRVRTEESKAAMSAKMKAYWTGRERVSSTKGKILSADERAAISVSRRAQEAARVGDHPLKSRKFSEETLRRMGDAQRARRARERAA